MAANQYPFGVGKLSADALNLALADVRRTGLVARRVAAQLVATGPAGAVAIAWDTEDYDSDNFLAPTASTITISVAGVYSLSAHLDNGAATGLILQQFSLTSALVGNPGLYRTYTPSSEPYGLVAATIRFAAGDSFQVVVQHGSTVNKNYTAALQCWRVSG